MKAVIMDEKDSVATAVVPIKKGEKVRIGETEIEILSDIPQGHKFAIREIKAGEPIIKYGEIIGIATEDIKPGEYVHVHNVKSRYQRGYK
ncbi:altronate hydrolase [Thermococcus sp. MV5]|uniref:UxaA family hydrolase n=1 Tax=Thermococcus sp. MV5 TaxID=1638272 RepID=UPI0014394396|nr:UxaA family hydrolase [Thermococcus sp. MV5]NJE26129.1 altronate hydrolase [Thermococcus sp. MV5]